MGVCFPILKQTVASAMGMSKNSLERTFNVKFNSV